MATKRDYYDILGVSKSATAAELKTAYRKKALEWHPDRNKSADAETKFKEINEAYQVLSDSKKKATYDQYGHSAFDPTGGGAPGGYQSQGPFQYYYSGSGGDFSGFSDPFDIFEQFFGGSTGGRRAASKPHYSLRIPFMTAIKGGEETVTIDGKKHSIKVPAGTNTGTHLRFKDFDITFEVGSHAQFKRDGDDIYIDHTISFTTAILGGETHIDTLDGDLKLKIRAGTQPGTTVRLSGQGAPHVNSLRRDDRGDFYIRLQIKFPDNLSRKQRQLLEEFERSQ